MAVRVTLNHAGFEQLMRGDVVTGMLRAGGRVRDRGKRNIVSAGRAQTGKMAQNISVEVVSAGMPQTRVRVTAHQHYSIYQEEGTRTPILPRRARVLRFKPKGKGAFVFARQVRGIQGIKFMQRALADTSSADFV